MAEPKAPPAPRLILVSGPEAGPDLAPALAAACAAGDVAAVILHLAPADERSLVKVLKALAPAAQEAGAAVVVACPAEGIDLVSVAARGGADGIHVADGDLGDLRGRLRDGRILGTGGLATRHEAMEAGEAAVDYVLFGDLPGTAPETVRERAEWWAEIFETPCVALAGSLDAVADLATTGAEFVALDAALWAGPDGAATVAAAQARLGTGA
ncbi:thiamine phosphate synthase [uncultured Methylobacterium sp.]|jgi:thiamine-phosphate pyrophosphorylase|uniref:thiamine phosphate synthase n=1 Tax=uncultured Methylobacterium sp. TaxID=157278 RepID=UPI002609E0EE|nr:thiamine phosphate synthase [uncultured Methylobacterium sp.]